MCIRDRLFALCSEGGGYRSVGPQIQIKSALKNSVPATAKDSQQSQGGNQKLLHFPPSLLNDPRSVLRAPAILKQCINMRVQPGAPSKQIILHPRHRFLNARGIQLGYKLIPGFSTMGVFADRRVAPLSKPQLAGVKTVTPNLVIAVYRFSQPVNGFVDVIQQIFVGQRAPPQLTIAGD